MQKTTRLKKVETISSPDRKFLLQASRFLLHASSSLFPASSSVMEKIDAPFLATTPAMPATGLLMRRSHSMDQGITRALSPKQRAVELIAAVHCLQQEG